VSVAVWHDQQHPNEHKYGPHSIRQGTGLNLLVVTSATWVEKHRESVKMSELTRVSS
jgi:hypothetical protein